MDNVPNQVQLQASELEGLSEFSAFFHGNNGVRGSAKALSMDRPPPLLQPPRTPKFTPGRELETLFAQGRDLRYYNKKFPPYPPAIRTEGGYSPFTPYVLRAKEKCGCGSPFLPPPS